MFKTNFEKIIEFHTSFDLPYSQSISIENMENFKIASLRIKLIAEEFNELCSAKNIIEQYDAIGDLLYVVYGAGASFGLNLDRAFDNFCSNILQQKTSNIDTNFQKALTVYKILRTTLTTYVTQNGSIREFEPFNVMNDNSINFNQQIYRLSYAILMCNVNEVTEILVKMLFSLYGVGYFCNTNLNVLFTEIHKSNMSKLCRSEKEAYDTIEWYQKNQLQRYPNPAFSKTSNNMWVVYDATTGKRLKSINYLPPNIELSDLIL